jgi:hypothetical protein
MPLGRAAMPMMREKTRSPMASAEAGSRWADTAFLSEDNRSEDQRVWVIEDGGVISAVSSSRVGKALLN